VKGGLAGGPACIGLKGQNQSLAAVRRLHRLLRGSWTEEQQGGKREGEKSGNKFPLDHDLLSVGLTWRKKSQAKGVNCGEK